MSSATDTAQPVCVADTKPAVARLLYYGQGYLLGNFLCTKCATCTDPRCSDVGTVMDSDYEEQWCRQHADAFPVDERVSGPDIVVLDSDRYRKLLADVGDG